MRRLPLLLGVSGVAVVTLSLSIAAGAEEPPRAPVGPMILDLLSRPLESREKAYAEWLRRDAANPPAGAEHEVMPDGSVRYGRSTLRVIIKDCPEEALLRELASRPLPGRPRR